MWTTESIREIYEEHMRFDDLYRTNRYSFRPEHRLDLQKMKNEYDRRWNKFWIVACEKNPRSKTGWLERLDSVYAEYLEIKNNLGQWVLIAKLESK